MARLRNISRINGRWRVRLTRRALPKLYLHVGTFKRLADAVAARDQAEAAHPHRDKHWKARHRGWTASQYMRERYQARKALGLCPECQSPTNGHVMCEDCLLWRRKKAAALRL